MAYKAKAVKTIALSSIALTPGDTYCRARGILRGQIVERRRNLADSHDVSWFRRSANGKWVAIKSPWTSEKVITVDGSEVVL